jgi:hypothetical protein
MALDIIHDREGESMEVEPLPPSTSRRYHRSRLGTVTRSRTPLARAAALGDGPRTMR